MRETIETGTGKQMFISLKHGRRMSRRRARRSSERKRTLKWRRGTSGNALFTKLGEYKMSRFSALVYLVVVSASLWATAAFIFILGALYGHVGL